MHAGDLRGLVRALRLLMRRHWWHALAWALPLWAVMASVGPSYESLYPDPASRAFLVREAQNSPAMTMLMGELTMPGAVGQLIVWKPGTYVIVSVIVMAIVHTAGMARRDEQDGLTETLLAAGAGRWTPFMAAAMWMGAMVAFVAVGVGASLSVSAVALTSLTALGAWTFAGVVAAVGWTFVALTLLVAQFLRDPNAVRGTTFALFGLQWLIRIIASQVEMPRLRWLSPMAWRDLVDPYGADRPAAIVVGTLSALVLLGAATLAHSRRELLGALLPDRSGSGARWNLRRPWGLRARLGWRHLAWWSLVACGVSAFFGSMTGSMREILYESPETAAYLEALGGTTADVVATFMQLLTLLTVLMALVGAIQRAGWLAADEMRGLVGATLAQGVSRTRLYVAHVLDTLVVGALLLLLAGVGLAAATAHSLPSDHAAERAAVYTLSQGPGVLAAIGVTCALGALWPRLTSLAWLSLAWAAAVSFIGELLDLPEWLRKLTYLGLVIDVVGPVETSDWVPLLIQALVGFGGIAVGWWAFTRCDLVGA
ncbi:Tat pathway signal protein [Schaalia sp. 19OD2882]|uniref:Tat pathway signal protein n=1 Tax=Schaalia sp. 19OD2882 TaxID=2794089 RepID=UPI001C1EFA0B|nr:Tat pathway signal protein [Schaalia sp. 19OD2882]QWW19913.1 Tat pathway signal protein [Schaalia sp. 19OD2882]